MDVNVKPGFKRLLINWKLSKYIAKFEELGYDCVDDWFTDLSLEELMDEESIGMKRGQARKFLLRLQEYMALNSVSNASNDANTIAVKVYINEKILKTHSFDPKKDVSQTIEIEKQKNKMFLLSLKTQIPHAFQHSFKAAFNDINKYTWVILTNDSYAVEIGNEEMLMNQLAINANNNVGNNNNSSYVLQLRVVFKAKAVEMFDHEIKVDESHVPQELLHNYFKPVPYSQYNSPPFSWNDNPNKTIVFLGSTGSGKTSSINSMMNYLYNVQMNDVLRHKLIFEDIDSKSEADSQTEGVNFYLLRKPPTLNYNLTIVDTPGFCDTRGEKVQEQNTININDLFLNKIKEVDMICFVTQASDNRVTNAQISIFNELLNLFSVDIVENLFVLVTFADYSKPCVLAALERKNVPYQKYFKINNAAFQLPVKCTSTDWNRSITGFQEIFQVLDETETKSLTMTRDLLKLRDKLQGHISGIRRSVKDALLKWTTVMYLVDEVKARTDLVGDALETEPLLEKVVIQDYESCDKFCMNCKTCKKTCCYGCTAFMSKCKASSFFGRHCTVCRCPMSSHLREEYEYKTKTVDTFVSKEELVERVVQNIENLKGLEHLSISQIILQSLTEIIKIQEKKVYDMVNELRKCIIQLNRIALRPKSLSMEEYIDLMIEEEKTEGEEGYEDRVGLLQKLKLHKVQDPEIVENTEIVAQENDAEIEQVNLNDDDCSFLAFSKIKELEAEINRKAKKNTGIEEKNDKRGLLPAAMLILFLD